MGWTIGVRFPERTEGIYSLRHCIQTGSGAHHASYPTATRGYFPDVNLTTHHPPPFSVEVTNAWIYVSTPPYIFGDV